MFDKFETNRVAEPRLTVRFDGDGTWSAWRGAILLASGLPTVGDAWDVIDRAASARPVRALYSPISKSGNESRNAVKR